LLSEGRVCKIGDSWFAQQVWEQLAEEAVFLVSDLHRQHPLRSGLSKEEWRTRLHLTPRMATDVFAALALDGKLEIVPDTNMPQVPDARGNSRVPGGLIRVFNFTPRFDEDQQQRISQLLQRFRAHPATPPERSEAEKLVGGEILNALLEQGRLVKVGTSLLFLREAYEEAHAQLVAYLQIHGKITVAEARDVLGGSRKYIVPFLEQMDALHVTRRIGDERVLGLTALRSASEKQDV
jgi:selenocysteine-specific elongation factor